MSQLRLSQITFCQHWNIRIRDFSKLTKLAILTSEAFYYVKKIQCQNVTPCGYRTQAVSDSKSNTILSTLTWHVLLGRSLNFCSCTTWCLDLDDLRRINRAWLYKETKSLSLASKCQVGVERIVLDLESEVAWVLFPLAVIFCHCIFFT